MKNLLLDDSPITRGQRLRKIRHLAGLSAEQLAEKTGYSRQTISYWENATHSGLSAKGAAKVIAVVKELGVSCDSGWLLYGVGETANWLSVGSPGHTAKQIAEDSRFQPYLNQPPLLQEMELFKQTHENAVIAQIKHSAMLPIYELHDWVGGCFEPIHPGLFNKACIVNLKGSLTVGLLYAGDNLNTYHLHALDTSQTSNAILPLENISLQQAAKIIRVWRE